MEERIDKQLKIAYLGNSLLDTGFRIAGITESYVASSGPQAEEKLKELSERDDIGIIILTSGVGKMIRNRRLSELISTSILPLMVEVPELNEQLKEEDTLRNLIMRAIGIDITKNV